MKAITDLMETIWERFMWPMYLVFTGIVVLVMGMVLQDTLISKLEDLGPQRNWFPILYLAWVIVTGMTFILYGAGRAVKPVKASKPADIDMISMTQRSR